MKFDTETNAKQVGGLHYKTAYQHWDLVRDLRLGYFEGQITKYITRHRVKNKRQDLEKAQHFAEKLLELASKNGWVPGHSFGWHSIEQRQRYFSANQHMTNGDKVCLDLALIWRMPADVVKLVDAIKYQIEQAYPNATPLYMEPPAGFYGHHRLEPVVGKETTMEFPDDGASPGASYVNQDQGHG